MDNGKQASFSLAGPTSGQWSLDDSGADPRFARVVSDNGTVVAELCGLASTVAANGRILAASKNMLAVLQAVVRWHDQINADDVARMKAVIAEATGEPTTQAVSGREALEGMLLLDLQGAPANTIGGAA